MGQRNPFHVAITGRSYLLHIGDYLEERIRWSSTFVFPRDAAIPVLYHTLNFLILGWVDGALLFFVSKTSMGQLNLK